MVGCLNEDALQFIAGVARLGRIYNCGGWVMHNDKNYHPACHIFAVDEGGDEYLLDVSYEGVKVGGDSDTLEKAVSTVSVAGLIAGAIGRR